MTSEELRKLDNYGHIPLEDLTLEQAEEYWVLVQERSRELYEFIHRKRPRIKKRQLPTDV